MYELEFHGKKFRVREIDLPEFGIVTISTSALNELLLREDGSYFSNNAILVDEQIFFFVEENEIEFSEQDLRSLLIEQVC